MRAFIGIELEPVWRDALSESCSRIREMDDAWRSEKWVQPENLHVTLKFLGEISSECALTLSEDLRELAHSVDPFILLQGECVQAIPSARRASMLWCTFSDPDGECAELAEAIERLANVHGIAGDEHTFTPHVTLVRARRPRPFTLHEPATQAAQSLLLRAGVTSMSVRDVTFFRSTLTRTGPRYERLTIARLGD